MGNYIAYYRVSTQKQGLSGLGLDAQKSDVTRFIKQHPGCELIADYQETESGKNNHRPQLMAALAACKANNAILLIAKLDRLTRNAAFLFALRDGGTKFVCCDMPDANELTIGIMAVIAEHERNIISARTRAALAEKKKQLAAEGKKLGPPQKTLTPVIRMQGTTAIKAKAATNENTIRAAVVIKEQRCNGLAYRNIATNLNKSKFVTPNGKTFSGMQVNRIYNNLATYGL